MLNGHLIDSLRETTCAFVKDNDEQLKLSAAAADVEKAAAGLLGAASRACDDTCVVYDEDGAPVSCKIETAGDDAPRPGHDGRLILLGVCAVLCAFLCVGLSGRKRMLRSHV
jgi:hypothetical protein